MSKKLKPYLKRIKYNLLMAMGVALIVYVENKDVVESFLTTQQAAAIGLLFAAFNIILNRSDEFKPKDKGSKVNLEKNGDDDEHKAD